MANASTQNSASVVDANIEEKRPLRSLGLEQEVQLTVKTTQPC